MSDFYDVKDMLAFMLRKLKVFILIIIITIAGFVAVRLSSLLPQYLEGKNQSEETESNTTTETQGEPIYKQVEMVVRIDPLYRTIENGEEVDETPYVVSAYLANQKSDDIINTLSEKFISLEEKESETRKETLYAYGYILDKERNIEYGLYDFVSQMKVNANYGTTGNYVSVGFNSTNQANAEEIAIEYEKLLTAKVKEQIGDFTCEVVETQINYQLPSASSGAYPSRTATNSISVSSVNTISLSTLIKQLIKGIVWGAVLGLVFAVILLAIWYFISAKLQRLSEVEELGSPSLGSYMTRKRGLHRLIVNWAYKIEGAPRVFSDEKEIAEVISAVIETKPEGTILISGSGPIGKIESFAKALKDHTDRDIKVAEYILNSAESIRLAKEAKNVILIEELGKTLKKEAAAEIEIYKAYGLDLLGIIMAE